MRKPTGSLLVFRRIAIQLLPSNAEVSAPRP